MRADESRWVGRKERETERIEERDTRKYKAPYYIRHLRSTQIMAARLLLLLLAGGARYCPHHVAHAAIVSEEWCLKRGFDPTNLSCDTCALIDESTTLQRLQKRTNEAMIQRRQKEGGETMSVEEIIDISSECRTCCKSYKVNPILRPGQSLRGKYKYALLK